MSKKMNIPEFGPLAGVRVVFSAIEIAGPFSAQMLAEWGLKLSGSKMWHTRIHPCAPNYPEYSRRNCMLCP